MALQSVAPEEQTSAQGILEDLRREHRALDLRIKELAKMAYLTPTEQMEQKRLKKLKLLKKDQIHTLSQELA